MNNLDKLKGRHKLMVILLLAMSAIFGYSGFITFHGAINRELSGPVFCLGLCAYCLGYALDPIALTDPRNSFNWKVISNRSKVLQLLAITLLIAALLLSTGNA